MDFEHIDSVIAHEYLHNWSGNRVTCRDWFQLSLKEGFTVFREQQFTQYITQSPVCRIENVKLLKILCGDPSDNIYGIKLLGVKKLLNIFPELKTEKLTLNEVYTLNFKK